MSRWIGVAMLRVASCANLNVLLKQRKLYDKIWKARMVASIGPSLVSDFDQYSSFPRRILKQSVLSIAVLES
jgi:hypothetical protein